MAKQKTFKQIQLEYVSQNWRLRARKTMFHLAMTNTNLETHLINEHGFNFLTSEDLKDLVNLHKKVHGFRC